MKADMVDQILVLQILDNARSQERITSEEALVLLSSEDYHHIGQAADCVRSTKHPFVIFIENREMKKATCCRIKLFLKKLKALCD